MKRLVRRFKSQLDLPSTQRPLEIPRRVVHVTEAPLGGVVTYLEEMITSQIALGIHVDLVTPEINVAAMSDVSSPRFQLVPFRHVRGSFLALLRLAWATVCHVRMTRPEILHIHSTFAGVIVRCCWPLLPKKTRIVYCPHGWAFSRQGSTRLSRAVVTLERFLSRFSDRIICISEYERREALSIGIPEERLVVIENGVSAHLLAAPSLLHGSTNGKLLAFVGRFDRQKGFDIYLEVLRRLEGEAYGIAIGSALTSGNKIPDLPNNVERLGWQPRARVLTLYAQADLLLVPSRWEGFGLVAIEAMQAKLAVFASRVGGLQDIVVDDCTGRLFEVDRVDQIVNLVREASPEMLRTYGERGYQRYLDRYTADRMNRRVMDLYTELTCIEETPAKSRLAK